MAISVDKLTNTNVKAVNFTSENKLQESVSKSSSNEDSSKLYMSLACLATLGLGAIATVAGYRKGVVKGKALGQAEGLVKGELDTLKSLTTISFKDFKKIGKFDKSGVATVDGKPFSGKITRPFRNGETVITYKDGLKQEAVIPQWGGTSERRLYNHENSNVRVISSNNKELYSIRKEKDGSMVKEFPFNNEYDITKGNYTEHARQEFHVHKPEGGLKKYKKSSGVLSHPDYKGGKPVSVRKVVDLETGQNVELIQMKNRPLYTGWARKHVMVDGEKVTVHYDDFGRKFSYAHTSNFDPKTGLTTYRYYELDEAGKLVPTNKYCVKDVKKTGADLTYKLDEEGNKYDLCLSDYQNGNVKNNVHDGSRYWTDLEQIKSNIQRLGLQITL